MSGIAQTLAAALRRTDLRGAGINLFLAAGQEISAKVPAAR
jgi:hypothetical protein